MTAKCFLFYLPPQWLPAAAPQGTSSCIMKPSMSRQSRPPVSARFEQRHGPSQASMRVSEHSAVRRRAAWVTARLQKNYQPATQVSKCTAATINTVIPWCKNNFIGACSAVHVNIKSSAPQVDAWSNRNICFLICDFCHLKMVSGQDL